MGNKKSKTLADMVKEEEYGHAPNPIWSVQYKNFDFIAYENSFYDDRKVLSCYILRDGIMLEHSGRTIYFTKEKALKELQDKYIWYLKNEVIEILKNKAQCLIVEGSELTSYISIYFPYHNQEEWDKVKEFFEYEQSKN